ncbi:diaminopimelate decarboxylase [Dongia sp.]|uniref:diaminopimelate decarboxylase n=1 Tax=Dongia sp. TaxID=1977262 RepID=UPI0035B194B1
MSIAAQHALPPFLTAKGANLALDGHDLTQMAAAHGSPLFVFSGRQLAGNAKALLAAARAGHPRARIFFASKACSNLHVLQIIRKEGLSIEVNSGGELWKAQAAGFKPAEIVFNGVAKSVAELELAIGLGIQAINVDSAFELSRIAEVATRLGKVATVALRIVPGIGGGATAGIQTGSERSKFGIGQTELTEALDIARSHAGVLDVAGMHLHIGSQVLDLPDFLESVSFTARQAQEIAQHLGKPLRHLNLGGGYPINYVHQRKGANTGRDFDLSAFAAEQPAAGMMEAVARAAARALGPQPEIFFEPGRSMVADCALLLTRVENMKRRGATPWLYLDGGYNLLLDSAAVRWYYHMVNASRMEAPADADFRVVGPLCDSADCFFDVEGEYLWDSLKESLAGIAGVTPELLATLKAKTVRLPETRALPAATAPGDLVALLDTGAYSLEEMFQYCGRQRAKAVMIAEDDSIVTLRDRDRPEDLVDAAERMGMAAAR